MPRIRTIKPEFPQSESMGRVSRDARLLFILSWTLADDSGRLRGNSRMLASLLFPYDDDAPNAISGWLAELERENCIRRYEVGDHQYVEICKWLEHQKIDKPSPSKFPPFANVREDSPKVRDHSAQDQGPRTKDQGPRTKDQGRENSAIEEQSHDSHNGYEYSPEFQRFWAAYPVVRKVAKGNAFEEWRNAVRKADPEVIIKAAGEYAASPLGSGEFSMMPQTWLTGRCWEDDRQAWQGGNAQRASKCPTDEDLANWNPITG